jgi:predicted nuclease of predicted toxin-antitoxin system
VALRAAAHNVVWVRTEAPGIVDPEGLALSAAESRVLLTFDKDFGELAWNARLPPGCGIVLFRLAAMGATEVCNGIATILNGRDDWVGHFSVVEPSRIPCIRSDRSKSVQRLDTSGSELIKCYACLFARKPVNKLLWAQPEWCVCSVPRAPGETSLGFAPHPNVPDWLPHNRVTYRCVAKFPRGEA